MPACKIDKHLYIDPRYKVIHDLILMGSITKLFHFFEIIPVSVLAKDMHVNYKSILNKVSHPNLFTIEDINRVADIIWISGESFYHIANNSIVYNDKQVKGLKDV